MKKLLTLILIGASSATFAQIPYSSKSTDDSSEFYRSLFHKEQTSTLPITPSLKSFVEVILDGMPVLKPAETDSEMVAWLKSPEEMPNPLLRKEPK